MRAAAIVNPTAAGGSAGSRWRDTADAVESRLGKVECRFTRCRGHAVELARTLALEGFDPIVAAGGDGTLNEVVNGVLSSGRPARIGVLPLASGGDFARVLGVRGAAEAIEVIAAGKARRLDAMLAWYVGESGPEQRYFVNVASIGLGAAVARAMGDKGRLLRGRAGYLAAAVRRVASGRVWEVGLRVDRGVPVSCRLTTAVIANGRYQGGGMLVAPLAEPDDGCLDVTVVEQVGLATLARHIGKLYSGNIYAHRKVRHWRGVRLSADASLPVPFECDGEPVGLLPVEVETFRGAWWVLAS